MNNKKFDWYDGFITAIFVINIVLCLLCLLTNAPVSPVNALCGWTCALIEVFKRR
jgi:hypothetical protein